MLDPKKEAELLGSRFAGKSQETAPEETPKGAPAEPQPVVEPEPPPPEAPRGLLLMPLVIGAMAGYTLFDSEVLPTLGSVGGVETVEVARGTIERTIRVTGSIAARRSVAIRTPRIRGRGGGGQLTLIELAAAGSRVSKGDVIAEFDRETYIRRLDDIETQVVQREASIKRTMANQSIDAIIEKQRLLDTKATLDKARLDVQASEVLSAIRIELAKMTVQQSEADLAELEGEVQLAEIARRSAMRAVEIEKEQTMIDLKRAEINLERLVIRAPIDGMIVMLSSSRGGDVATTAKGDQVRSGTYFMQVVDTSAMVLEGSVNQVDSQTFRSGLPARVQLDAYPGASWPARLTSIGALASSAAAGGGGRGGFSRGGVTSFRRELSTTFSIDSDDSRIIPDLSASADVILESEGDVLLVPRAAIGRQDGQAFAYARMAGTAEFSKRIVELGLVTDGQAAVRSGLSEGEEIAVIAAEVELGE